MFGRPRWTADRRDRHCCRASAKSELVGPRILAAQIGSPTATEWAAGWAARSRRRCRTCEHKLPKDAPLRALFLADREAGAAPHWTYNMLLRHGVRSCLDYAMNFDRCRQMLMLRCRLQSAERS